MFVVQHLNPSQAKDLVAATGVANLDSLALDAGCNLLALALQDNLARCCFGELVEASAVAAQETLKLLLGDVIVSNDTALGGFLEREQDQLGNIGLGEDTSRGFALLGGSLGVQRMGSTVTSTKRLLARKR